MAHLIRRPRPGLAAALAATLWMVACPAAPANSTGVDALMGRLFHLVQKSYADIASTDAQLKRSQDDEERDRLSSDLAEKIAAFQEKDRKILQKMPEVQDEHPDLSPKLARYGREIERMETRVREMIARHEISLQVTDLRAAAQQEDADAAARAAEQNPWETSRAGAPAGAARIARKARLAPFEMGGDERPAPRRRAGAIEPAMGSAAVPKRGSLDDITALVRKIRDTRGDGNDKQLKIAIDDPKDAADVAALAATKPGEDRSVPIAMSVLDGRNHPVARRRVEFILESEAGSPVTAYLMDGSARVQGNSLLEITDEQGMARIELRLEGESRKVRIQRTVVPQADRTVCRLRVTPA